MNIRTNYGLRKIYDFGGVTAFATFGGSGAIAPSFRLPSIFSRRAKKQLVRIKVTNTQLSQNFTETRADQRMIDRFNQLQFEIL